MKMESFGGVNPHQESLEKSSIPRDRSGNPIEESSAQQDGNTKNLREKAVRNPQKISDPEVRQWLLSIPADEDYRRALRLMHFGLLKKGDGGVVLDKNKLAEFPLRASKSSKKQIYDTLSHLSLLDPAISEDQFKELLTKENTGRFAEGRLAKGIELPSSLQDLVKGQATSGKLYKGEEGGAGWYGTTTLADGTVTTPTEIKIAQRLAEIGAERREDGKLYATKGEHAGSRMTLNYLLGEHAPRAGKSFKEASPSQEIFNKYIPNLRSMGLIREDDFSIRVKHKRAYTIELKEKTTKDIVLRNTVGSAKYYLGDIQNKEHVFCATLDDRTGGVFLEEGGVKVLTYTFPLMTEAELELQKVTIAEHLGKGVQDLTPTEVTQYARKNVPSEALRQYNVTDYITQYKGEDPVVYAARVSEYKDAEAVVTGINNVFLEANIDHVSVGWGKKIRLAEAMKHMNSADVISFASTFGGEGLQMLLVSDADPAWPEELLELSRKNPKLVMRARALYGPLLTDEEEFRGAVATITENGTASEYVADARRASLAHVIERVRLAAERGGSVEQAFPEAELMKQHILFKALKESGASISIQEIKNAKLDHVRGTDITPEMLAQMHAIYSRNQSDSVQHDELMQKFLQRIQDPETHFYLFNWSNNLESFVGFREVEGEGKEEAFAFNVSPGSRGYRVGETMLEQVLNREAQEHILSADCDAKLPISAKYIETGWAGISYKEERNTETGKSDWILDIIRDDRKNTAYWGKGLNKEEIRNSQDIPAGVRIEQAPTQAELPFELCNEGYVLTRLVKDSGMYYGVFEPKESITS